MRMNKCKKLKRLYITQEDIDYFLSNKFLFSVENYNTEQTKNSLKGEIGMLPSFKLMQGYDKKLWKRVGLFKKIKKYKPTYDEIYHANLQPKSYRVILKK